MCGIFGYFGADERAHMDRMASLLTHRGPDDFGYHATEQVGVGNTRLSIIDLAHGHQPFHARDGKVVVVQNGEIFNYKELMAELEELGYVFETQCDTEVILHGYRAWGEHFVERLNGMFAIAVWDAEKEVLHLYRDRIGVKPLYYYQHEGRFLFASEIKAILGAGVERVPNKEALHHFLSFNYTPTPFTFFEHIHQVKPGHHLSISQAGVQERRWWDFTAVPQAYPESEEAVIEELMALLKDATRIRLRSDVEIGAFLSGGVDSSSVVGLATQQMERPLRTFSIGFEDARYDESPYAKAASERFHTEHISRIVEPDMLQHWPFATYYCDQPHGDVSFMPTYCVSQLAAEHLKVVLTGDGSDELFAGYDKYKAFAPEGEGWQQRYFESISLLSHAEKQALYGEEMAHLKTLESYQLADDFFARVKGWDGLNQMLAFDMEYLLSGNNLAKPDRMGMAVSIEARTPFMDYRVMEYALSLPGDYKLRDGETKYILKKAVSDLIGEDLAYRKKQMFTVPIGDWLSSSLSGFMQSMLCSNQFAARGLFDQAVVQRMVNEHRDGSANHTRILRALIAIELWYRIFIDRDELAPPSFEELGIELPKVA